MILSPINVLEYDLLPMMLPAPITSDTNQFQLDRGLQYQSMPIYLGPTLGWINEFVRPARYISANTTLGVGDSVALILTRTAVTITLPEVTAWLKEPSYRPYNEFERHIWIKDIDGLAATNPATVLPFSGQTIDLSSSASLNQNFQILRLYPLTDSSGWFIG